MFRGLSPRPTVRLACGSMSTHRTVALLRQRPAEVDRGGRLADAAFLVRDRDDACHRALRSALDRTSTAAASDGQSSGRDLLPRGLSTPEGSPSTEPVDKRAPVGSSLRKDTGVNGRSVVSPIAYAFVRLRSDGVS